MTDLVSIKQIMDTFLSAIEKNKVKGIIGTPLERWAKDIRFDYFHSDTEHAEGIRLCKEMVHEDANLIKSPQKYGKRKFSEISPFVRGCVRLSYKN